MSVATASIFMAAFSRFQRVLGHRLHANENDGSALEIEHDGEVTVAMPDRDFVDGDPFDVFEFRLMNWVCSRRLRRF
ncbi:MAG: hypothetical protein U0798_02445 [Gemmataceae bacterium]